MHRSNERPRRVGRGVGLGLCLSLAALHCSSSPSGGDDTADDVRLAEDALVAADETTPSTPCTNSAQLSTYGCARALDNQFATYGAILTSPGWLRIDLGAPKPVNTLELSAWSGGFPNRYAKNYRLLASNSGAFAGEETVLFAYNGEQPWTTETRSRRFFNTTPYRYYKLDVSANQGDYWLEITELQLKYDPAPPAQVDVDEDGRPESKLTLRTCTTGGGTCLAVESTTPSKREVRLSANALASIDVGLLGKHFGGAYSAAYAYYAEGAGEEAKIAVVDLNTKAVKAYIAAPLSLGYTRWNSYFGLVRGPNTETA